MSVTDLHALSGVYALDALDTEESDQFEDHLATCAACRHEVMEFHLTAATLAEAVAEPPPQDLRARVLAAATAQPQPDRNPTVTEAAVDDLVERRRSRPRRRLVVTVATAAAVVALVAAVTVVALTRRSSEMDVAEFLRDPRTSVITMNGPSGETARVVWSQENGQAVLLANRMPPIRADEVYEVWFIDGGQPRPGPTVHADTPDIEHRFAVSSGPPQQLAVTIEPAPGTPKAVGPIILSGETPK